MLGGLIEAPADARVAKALKAHRIEGASRAPAGGRPHRSRAGCVDRRRSGAGAVAPQRDLRDEGRLRGAVESREEAAGVRGTVAIRDRGSGLRARKSIQILVRAIQDLNALRALSPEPEVLALYAATPAISRISPSWLASARGSSPTTRPPRNTRMRVERLSTSGISLEMRMMALPAAASSSMSA